MEVEMIKPGMPIDGPTVLAALALSLQNIVLEIEANGGPDRTAFANRIKAGLGKDAENNPLGYCLSLIADVIEREPDPKATPDLRLV